MYPVIVIIDEQEKIWTNYFGYETTSLGIHEFICLNDIENHPFNGLQFTKASVNQNSNTETNIYALDTEGRIWFWGKAKNEYEELVLNSYKKDKFTNTPICFSNYGDLNEKKIVNIYAGTSSTEVNFAIDSEGNLYAWGKISSYWDSLGLPEVSENGIMCVSNKDGYSLKNVKLKDIAFCYGEMYFIDYDGELWVSGSNIHGISDINSQESNPICLTKLEGNPLYGKKMKHIYKEKDAYNTIAIDNDGKYWAWGNTDSDAGFGGYYDKDRSFSEPTCINNLENSKLQNTKMKSFSNGHGRRIVYGIDYDGNLWLFYGDAKYEEVNVPTGCKLCYMDMEGPIKIDFPQSSYFDLFEIQDMSINNKTSIIRDKSGKLWTPGHVREYLINDISYGLKDYLGTELGADIKCKSIEKYVCGTDSTLIVDENGKLWTVGMINHAYRKFQNYNKYTEIEPLCITDIEDIYYNSEQNPLYNKKIEYVTANNYSSGTVYAVIDEDGKLYTGGYKNRI